VCGTDVHLWHGRLADVPYPIIPGHVSAGTLADVRGPLAGLDGSDLREGDRVAFFDVHRTCGRCRACTVHRTPTRCSARRVYGITDPASEGLFGGWSQAIYLEPGVGIARLPESVTFDDYIGGGCGLLTAVHVLERAALRPGDTVVVQGTGAVGLSAIALSRSGGASTIIAIGAPAARLALARRMGADHVFDVNGTTREQRFEEVRRLTHGEGADVVLEAAGAAPAVSEGLDLVRDGGRYVIAGHYTDAGDTLINAHRQINRKHLEIRGCWGSEPGHFIRALALLERYAATVPWREVGGRTYSLTRLNDALADAEAMRITKALVDPWSAP
jgi:L-iditol 2-dehydrogenase